MIEVQNALAYLARDWDPEVSESLYDIIDSVNWPNLSMSYNTDTECLIIRAEIEVFASYFEELRIEVFQDKSIAVYGSKYSFATDMENIPVVVKCFSIFNDMPYDADGDM